jgi:hypothetical protein
VRPQIADVVLIGMAQAELVGRDLCCRAAEPSIHQQAPPLDIIQKFRWQS